MTLFEVKRMQYSAIRIKIIGTYRTDPMQLIFLTYSGIQNNFILYNLHLYGLYGIQDENPMCVLNYLPRYIWNHPSLSNMTSKSLNFRVAKNDSDVKTFS